MARGREAAGYAEIRRAGEQVAVAVTRSRREAQEKRMLSDPPTYMYVVSSSFLHTYHTPLGPSLSLHLNFTPAAQQLHSRRRRTSLSHSFLLVGMKFLSKAAPVAFLSLLATTFKVNAATIKRASVCNGHAEVSSLFLTIFRGPPVGGHWPPKRLRLIPGCQ